MNLEVLSYIVNILLLIAGGSWIGKGFLDRYLSNRQQHHAEMTQSAQQHSFDMEKLQAQLLAKIEEQQVTRESQAVQALVEMNARQSEAQIELTREALKTLNLMTSNVANLSITLKSTAQDLDSQQGTLRRELAGIKGRVESLESKLEAAMQQSRQTENLMRNLLKVMVSSSPNASPQVQEAASKL